MIACEITDIPSNPDSKQKKIRLPSIKDYMTQTQYGAIPAYTASPNLGNWPHEGYYPHHYDYPYLPMEHPHHSTHYYHSYSYHPYYPSYESYGYKDNVRNTPKQDPIPILPPKMKRQKKDPSAPKHPMSPFIYYLAEVRSQFTAKNPGKSGGEISKIIATHWRQLSEKDKMKYNEQCLNDKKRYAQEMMEWTRKKSPKPETSEQPSQESSQSTFVE
ncbi:hypothetical protein HDV06_003983 [Boothiomyces sp. JEL0866]|nr:hypothetical protein HDV06_003983 [Boothiomyces sp. JEL0866]